VKPAYNVPTMAEIQKIKGTNGLKVVSTFSGCGGACLGLEMAGYDVLYANEFVEAARDTYRLNHKGVHLDGRDIRTVTAQEILEITGLKPGELDLFEGSPPCASFSTVGKRAKGWGETKAYSDTVQRADDLFFEYARLLKDLQPKAFVAENVTGLVKGVAKGYFKEILTELTSAGYLVTAKILDASWLGVPQARQRLIFIGIRQDLAKEKHLRPEFPKPMPYQYSIGEAIDLNKQGSLDPETGTDISLDRFAIGAAWDRTEQGGVDRKYFSFLKPRTNAPSFVVTATAGNIGAASVVHPLEKRKFNLKELRALTSFPQDFELTGTYQQRVERIGRSVAPLMYKHVGEVLKTEFFAKL
jgi:DNA (cytosine-5)-methyltransferase 1